MGHDRRLFPDFLDWMLLNPAETFTVSAELGSGCSNGATYTVTASVSDETLTELAAATASFDVLISARSSHDTRRGQATAGLELTAFTVTYTDSNGDEVVISPSLVSGTTDYVIELPPCMQDDNIIIAWDTVGSYGYGYRTFPVPVRINGASRQYHIGSSGPEIRWYRSTPQMVRTYDGGTLSRHVFVTNASIHRQTAVAATDLVDYRYDRRPSARDCAGAGQHGHRVQLRDQA